jgi:hypothetical protein
MDPLPKRGRRWFPRTTATYSTVSYRRRSSSMSRSGSSRHRRRCRRDRTRARPPHRGRRQPHCWTCKSTRRWASRTWRRRPGTYARDRDRPAQADVRRARRRARRIPPAPKWRRHRMGRAVRCSTAAPAESRARHRRQWACCRRRRRTGAARARRRLPRGTGHAAAGGGKWKDPCGHVPANTAIRQCPTRSTR